LQRMREGGGGEREAGRRRERRRRRRAAGGCFPCGRARARGPASPPLPPVLVRPGACAPAARLSAPPPVPSRAARAAGARPLRRRRRRAAAAADRGRGPRGDRRRQTKQKTRAARRRRTSSLCPCARPGTPARARRPRGCPSRAARPSTNRKAGGAKVGERRRAAAAPPRPPAPPHPRAPPPLPPGRLPALFPHAQGSKSVQDALSRLLLKHPKTRFRTVFGEGPSDG